ncbi:unnamed protein product [Rotaria socialis]|uniref:Uncharacterized protein n=3 Tax=Rotaria socialis TaxID=392032 RepID=A0A820BUA1_9BILA|nr:unnamed protein product [Rotaria socialis]CAF4343561.1 unnamed protein product [Rotaria socialis]CAF4423990.1 unnamed protein product [Rotaria socialis]
MSKQYSTWASNQSVPSVSTDTLTIKLIAMKVDEQHALKTIKEFPAVSKMNVSNHAQTSPMTINNRALQTVIILKQRPWYFAAPIDILPSLSNEQNFVEQSSKDSASALKQNLKYKHQQSKIRHLHRERKTCVEQKPTNIYASKIKIMNSKYLDRNQKKAIVRSRVSNNTDQQTPLPIHRDEDVQSVSLNKNREKKTSHGNIPLQTIENKLVSQRKALNNETQVSSYPSTTCAQSAPSTINACCAPASPQVYYVDDCCSPSTINCGSNNCMVQQCGSIVCCPQEQEQQQIIICNNSMPSQNYCCSSSNNNCIQQEYICVDNTSNLSCCNPTTIGSCNQIYLCEPQRQTPGTASIVLQQQPQQIQIIQNSQPATAQYLQISSASPQVIQTVERPIGQNIGGGPQILYQRPYDALAAPAQQNQFVTANNSNLALSQPSYARTQPNMFRHALVRTVANKTGLPLPIQYIGRVPLTQSPSNNPMGGVLQSSPASPLITGASQGSTSLPIVPLTPGGLLIPFEPNESSQSMMRGGLPRTSRYFGTQTNVDSILRQIQHRANLLANWQQQINSNQISSTPVRSRNTTNPSLPVFTSNLPQSLSSSTINSPRLPSTFPSNTVLPQPIVNRSQTPLRNSNIFGSSSSSSNSSKSLSSSSSLARKTPNRTPSTAGLFVQPSFASSRGESIISRPSAVYQSFQP